MGQRSSSVSTRSRPKASSSTPPVRRRLPRLRTADSVQWHRCLVGCQAAGLTASRCSFDHRHDADLDRLGQFGPGSHGRPHRAGHATGPPRDIADGVTRGGNPLKQRTCYKAQAEPCRRLCVKVRRKLKSFGRGPSSRPTPPAPKEACQATGLGRVRNGQDESEDQSGAGGKHRVQHRRSSASGARSIHSFLHGASAARGMMPRNDTWRCLSTAARGRDAHQGLAEGLGPWRVGWSGPGRIGGGGSRRRAGPCRSPK